jgi:phage terminase Nu1 subunit (DNA packaging protein)
MEHDDPSKATGATQAECAAHLFCSVQRFRELLDAGTITRQANSAYNLDVVRREALTHLRNQAGARGASTTLSAARSALAHHQGEIARLKAGKLRGQFVELEAVGRALEGRYGVIREILVSIPGKCGDKLVNRERPEIIDILRGEINDALAELSRPAELIREASRHHDGQAV